MVEDPEVNLMAPGQQMDEQTKMDGIDIQGGQMVQLWALDWDSHAGIEKHHPDDRVRRKEGRSRTVSYDDMEL